ncbi:NAD(P)-dependent oxidoreductase [Streptomyces sp. NPDC051133]|uniref:NAD(P)-dependent oxidoreductase n=1 Tax=Streptomyces sp. NPDC051133 TaxID=3155521 RepID=UPI00343E5D51
MRIGFIGLGRMGGPIAKNVLTGGHCVTVHDLRPEAAVEHLTQGAVWAETPEEVGLDSDVVITMLPGPYDVEEVLLGGFGLLRGLAAGSIWVDLSTCLPETANRIRLAAAPHQIAVVDAPISGNAEAAAAGTLQMFVGGNEADVTRVLPILKVIGDPSRMPHVGPHGAGYTVKLLINLLWCSHLIAASEALSLGVKAGVDLTTLYRSLLCSPAAGSLLEQDILSVFKDGEYGHSLPLEASCKDLSLAVDLARDVGIPVELSALVEQIYQRARVLYGGQAGEMMPIRLYEDTSGFPLRTPQSEVER